MNAVCTPTRKCWECLFCSQPQQTSNSHRKKWDTLVFRLEIIWGQDHEDLLLLLCVAHGWMFSEELPELPGLSHRKNVEQSPQRKIPKEGRECVQRETAQDPTWDLCGSSVALSTQTGCRRCGGEGTWGTAELCFLSSDRSSELQLLPEGLLILNCWLKLQAKDLGCLSFMGFSDFSMLNKT